MGANPVMPFHLPCSQQAVLDQAPVCTPEVQELWITVRSGSRQPVTRLVCQGSRDGTTLTYSIAGGEGQPSHSTTQPLTALWQSRLSCPGNEDGRFQLEGNTILYLPNNPPEPRTFVLLVEVWGGSSAPRRSTVVALVVHITPRSTSVPPSTTTQRTVSTAQCRRCSQVREAPWPS